MDKNKKKIGAVLVQGGGIAGVQASLDLANSGFKVYLVDRSSAIGGMMSLLDKTFPTGDCATCIASPKFVECVRNLNIEILTLSEIVDLKGKAGHFKATIKRYPSYVDEDKCNGCTECAQVCPVEIPNTFDRELGTRKAIDKPYPQAIPDVFGILKNGDAPCKVTCPAKVNVQGYVQLIKKKEYLKAVNLIRERNPLSAICGRVCTHPCEDECHRRNIDSPIAIRLLKRFASDKELNMVETGELPLPDEKKAGPDAKKVAIIGSGPSGLTVANDLADRGFAVTVYEALPDVGGMLKWGIPEYRLPKKILNHEVELIRRKGVHFLFNCRISEDITFDKLQKNYDAIFIGTGAQKSYKLNVEGEEKEGIFYGIEFLREVALGREIPQVKSKVVVIGGGNVAVDVARSVRRLGAKNVEIIALEERDQMPAYPDEIKATLAEGIHIKNGWGPKRFFGNGFVNGIELKQCVMVFDKNGKFNPVYDENQLSTVEADQVIVAIGQAVDKEIIDHIGADTKAGYFDVTSETLQTSIEGVFAGGDCTSGPASIIEAVAAGKRAADSIERYLKGETLTGSRFEDTMQPIPLEQLPATGGVSKKPRAVSVELDIKERINSFLEVESGLSEEAALAETERCLNCALCSECGECLKICEQKAIDYTMTAHTFELEIGSVILCPGFDEFFAQQKGEFGHSRYHNVLTSVQFERMLSASGPYGGDITRPFDGKEAKRIAWIQCVGSRDQKCGNEYCSSICCMATIKQAMVATDHLKDMKTSIFYIDMRAYGKDFEAYYERAQSMENINFIKSIPSRIVQMPHTNNQRLDFINEKGDYMEEEFDLVVLSLGMDPKVTVSESISRLGIELNKFGFCASDRLDPLTTSTPGVFVAGAFQEPKDIPETVMQASAAASMSMELLSSVRNTMITKKEYPEEHDVTDEEARVGVFVCHCGINIASIVDVPGVVEAIKKEPGVKMVTHTMYTCSDSSLSEIKEKIREHRLNRIVVASCTPRTHEPLFRETLKEAGLNPYLFELANIRDQCSWIHTDVPEDATKKAIELVKMSIARAKNLTPLVEESIPINQSALVIGGGVSGMTAALSLANQGFTAYLVEKTSMLSGNLTNINSTLEHDSLNDFKSELISDVKNNQSLHLHLNTFVTGVTGHIGNFNVTLSHEENMIQIQCGAIIVATGAKPTKTTEYLYNEVENVMTQVEFEKDLDNNALKKMGQNIVMIQCVGSRNEDKPYCSRLCCSMAIKNALRLKKQDPTTNIYILYRDIRTYGFRESYYKQAREMGIIFIRFNKENLPVVSKMNGMLAKVTVHNPDFPETIEIETDLLVLSTGIHPSTDNQILSEMLKVPLNENGFFVEAHLKLRPVDFTTEGIFLCGLAHSPKFIDENISQAKAAAARAATVLSKTHMEIEAQISKIDQNKCISCMTCMKVCPYDAPFCNDDHKAEIVGAKCMGCGLCVSECPARAIQLNHFRTDHFEAMIGESLGTEKKDLIQEEIDYE